VDVKVLLESERCGVYTVVIAVFGTQTDIEQFSS